MQTKDLSAGEIVAITRAALKTVLPRTKIDKIVIGGSDSGFDPGVRITVVVSAGNSVNLKGEQLTKIVQIVSGEMFKKGDSRFPYFRYLTAQEMKQLAS
jgi:hypothetical protein